jgi:hypothetical protein
MSMWLVVAGLGAYHGLNPGMGWLFAVALGLQEGRATAVLRAIPPLAAGHALSVAAVALLATAASVVVPAGVLRLAGSATLLMFAVFLLLRGLRHPRGSRVGIRAGARELTAWSFIMSSAHGAGLMLLPVLLNARGTAAVSSHAAHYEGVQPAAAALVGFNDALTILAVHTGAMLVTFTAAALLTYCVLGLGFLRRAWVNLDVVWIGSLLVASAVTLLS